jgi:hypothetical protein
VATIFVRRIAVDRIQRAPRLRPVTSYHQAMLAPTRPLPRVGTRARVAHFGGGFEAGTVIAVHEQGRRLEVHSDAGERLEFVLSPATGRFVCAGQPHGPRLELLRAP